MDHQEPSRVLTACRPMQVLFAAWTLHVADHTKIGRVRPEKERQPKRVLWTEIEACRPQNTAANQVMQREGATVSACRAVA